MKLRHAPPQIRTDMKGQYSWYTNFLACHETYLGHAHSNFPDEIAAALTKEVGAKVTARVIYDPGFTYLEVDMPDELATMFLVKWA